ncbi:hypothetical protein MIR68_003007 [Amoeboaphelidium protococcarum]|nr:hypothetical protein MIR68_003007 [Amoeboaphelidium protococcarum]
MFNIYISVLVILHFGVHVVTSISVNTSSGAILCPQNQVFNSLSLQCVDCASNQVISNGKCLCESGYISSGNSSQCLKCPSGQTNSNDFKFCLQCPTSSSCQCPAEQVLVDRNAAGIPLAVAQCISCPTSYYSGNQSSCINCGDDNAAYSNISRTCQCSPPFYQTMQNGTCIPQAFFDQISTRFDVSTMNTLTFSVYNGVKLSKISHPSQLINNLLLKAIYQCQTELNAESCQSLANLCALTLYNSSSAPCQSYSDIARLRSSSQPLQWISSDQLSVANAASLLSSATGRKLQRNSYPQSLQFILLKYDVFGNFIGSELLHQQLMLDKVSDTTVQEQYLIAGRSFIALSNVDLLSVIQESKAQEFYDLYLVADDGSLSQVVIQLGDDQVEYDISFAINQYQGIDKSKFGRRFYLLDTVSGLDSRDYLKYIRYAQDVQLIVPIAQDNNIITPILKISYGTRLVSQLQRNNSTQISKPSSRFWVVYCSATSYFWYQIGIAVIVISILLFFYWSRAIQIWNRKNSLGSEGSSLFVIFGWIAIGCQYLGSILIFFMSAVTYYWYLEFKVYQQITSTVPSDSYSIYTFYTSLYTGLICMIVSVLFTLHLQCNSSIFLMDWEKSHHQLAKQQQKQDAQDRSKQGDSVSVWRRVAIARELVRLVVTRKTSLALTLVLLIAFDQGAMWGDKACLMPSTDACKYSPFSPILMFAIISFIWLMIEVCQLFIKHAVVDRLTPDPLLNLMDTSSLANISIFIMDCPYHGYYLHGKSVHQLADVDFQQFNAYLLREQSAVMNRRGLGNTDYQQFEVFINGAFQQTYLQLLNALQMNRSDVYQNRSAAARGQLIEESKTIPSVDESQPLAAERQADASTLKKADPYQSINKLLCNFVQNKIKGVSRVLVKRTLWNRLLGTIPLFGQDNAFIAVDDEGPRVVFTQMVESGFRYLQCSWWTKQYYPCGDTQ